MASRRTSEPCRASRESSIDCGRPTLHSQPHCEWHNRTLTISSVVRVQLHLLNRYIDCNVRMFESFRYRIRRSSSRVYDSLFLFKR